MKKVIATPTKSTTHHLSFSTPADSWANNHNPLFFTMISGVCTQLSALKTSDRGPLEWCPPNISTQSAYVWDRVNLQITDSESWIWQSCRRLSIRKKSDPDGFPARVELHCSCRISSLLQIFFSLRFNFVLIFLKMYVQIPYFALHRKLRWPLRLNAEGWTHIFYS